MVRLEIKEYTQVNAMAQDKCSVYESEWTLGPKATLSFRSTGIVPTVNFYGCAQKLRSLVSFY